MRIVNWNCCRGKHDVKLPPLLRLRPDLAIIQETPEPKTELATGQLWHGTNRNQGLMALTFGPWRLEPAGEFLSEPQFFLPARVIGPGESPRRVGQAGHQAPSLCDRVERGPNPTSAVEVVKRRDRAVVPFVSRGGVDTATAKSVCSGDQVH
jgi:hypothetical protein